MATRPKSAKLKLAEPPIKGARAWRCQFIRGGEHSDHYIPYSCINAYDPNTLTISIETWILKQKNIPFKV